MERVVFHDGEIAMQRAAGSAERMREIGPRVIRDHMPEQHRAFFEQLPMLVVGSVDERQRPWASVLAGLPGFVTTPDARHLRVEAPVGAGDPLRAQIRIGAALGLLGIEPQTRRRNRMNGTVVAVDGESFTLRVDQSFGNCPKYIQARAPSWSASGASIPQREGARLSGVAAAMVAQADTFFIASSAPGQGADVSHRGGRPGFVRIEQTDAGTVLSFPDYVGNFFFNTLGNITAHPRAGLLFIEYSTGGSLQLTGRAAVVAADPAVDDGIERWVCLEVDEGLLTPAALPLRWTAPAFAPQFATDGRG